MIQLRPYQTQLKNDVYDSWRKGHRNVVAVLPTGGGKTVVMSSMAVDFGEPTVAIAHRQELVQQISIAMARMDLPHRIVAPDKVISVIIQQHIKECGMSYVDRDGRMSVIGVDTLIRRKDDREVKQWANTVRYWQVDESHHLLFDNKWGTAVTMFPNARGVGFTATPIRCDRKSLHVDQGGVFDDMVVGLSMRDLIDMGSLADYQIYGPPQSIDDADLTISKSTGEVTTPSMKKAAEKSTLYGDIVSHYLRIAPGKRGITFVHDVDAANKVAAKFNEAGVPAAAVSAKTPDVVRNATIEKFRRGEMLQLVNVDLFGEGFDVPAVEVVSMGRRTESLGLFCQQFGRALRPFDGKDCVARGSLVLTDSGLKPIEDISLRDKVWDGCNFVSHGGAVCRGVRRVIKYQGLIATPDHKVWTKKGWRPFGECALEQIPIAQTGIGGTAIRECENLFARSDVEGETSRTNVRFDRMRDVRREERNLVYEPEGGEDAGLSKMQSAREVPEMVLRSDSSARTEVCEPEQSKFRKLRGAWYRISLCFGNGRSNLGKREPGYPERSNLTVGSNRQRWSLRAWKPAMVNTFAKLLTHAKIASERRNAQISARPSSCSIRGFDTERDVESWDETGRDYRTLVHSVLQTEREVWDILECGPLSRFTVQGLLVHNCGIIIDHVGNVKRHGLPDAIRGWQLLAEETGRRGVLTDPNVLPVTACSSCYREYERIHKSCPYCGFVEEPASRSEPKFVDGDLTEYGPELLEELRKKAQRLEGDIHVPKHLKNTPAEGAIRRKHGERAVAREYLKDAISQWAGVRRQQGMEDSEIYRRFYHMFGIDIGTAQTIDVTSEVQKLTLKVQEHYWT